MTFSVSAPTNNTGALLNNGTEVLSIDSSNNVNIPNSLDLTGNLTVDTDTLYVDASNNNVGIGISNGDYRLNILGEYHNYGQGDITTAQFINSSDQKAFVKAKCTNNQTTASAPMAGYDIDVPNHFTGNRSRAYFSLRSITDGNGGGDTSITVPKDLRFYVNNLSSLTVSDGAGPSSSNVPGTEAMRINSSGQLIHNGTSTFGYGGTAFFHSGAGGRTMNTYIGSGTLQSMAMWVGGAEKGYINSDSGGTTYNTTSDYRLKENVQPILEPINKVKLLKPCTWTWVDDESNGIGFIAHELAEVVPTAVSGTKDETETYTDENGIEQTRPKYQGVDQSRIIGLLTAALQEAITKIEDLETRIQTLENN